MGECNVRNLGGALHIATQASILRWCYSKDLIWEAVLEWERVCGMFYALPFEEREKWRVRPTAVMLEHEWNSKEQLWIQAYLEDQLAVRQAVAKFEHDWEDVDDLTQAAYLHAWENLHLFDGEAKFLSWLITVAINYTKDHIKMITAVKRPPLCYEHRMDGQCAADGEYTPYYDRTDLSAELSDALENSDVALDAEGDDTLTKLSASLSKRLAEVLESRLLGDTNPQIAQQSGSSENTVAQQVSRIKQKLQDECHNPAFLSSNSVQARTMDELVETVNTSFKQRFRAGRQRSARLLEQAELGRIE